MVDERDSLSLSDSMQFSQGIVICPFARELESLYVGGWNKKSNWKVFISLKCGSEYKFSFKNKACDIIFENSILIKTL